MCSFLVDARLPIGNFLLFGVTHRFISLVVLKACGLVKNLALMSNITVGTPADPILEFLEEWGTENFEVNLTSPLIWFIIVHHVLIKICAGNFSCCYYSSDQDFSEWTLGWYPL